MGFAIFSGVLALIAAGLGYYLVTRFHKFPVIKNMKNRWLSWLLAVMPVAAIGCFALINVTTMAVVLLHYALFWAVSDLIGAAVSRGRSSGRYRAGIVAVCFTTVYLAVGWYCGHHVFRTGYELSTEKDLPALRIVQIADTHFGITQDGDSFEKLCRRIEAEKPDILVVTGDFVDDDTSREDMVSVCRSLGGVKTTYGVYFAYGNHDNGYFGYRDFTARELSDELEKNGVTLLRDESVLVDGWFYVTGRLDRSMSGRREARELTSELDTSKYIIMLDHQPNDYEAEAGSGADLVLSGHTHGGHIFPAGLIGLAIGANDRVYGTEHRGGTDFIVTSGVSGWAIPFKTGTFSEYVVIDVKGR